MRAKSSFVSERKCRCVQNYLKFDWSATSDLMTVFFEAATRQFGNSEKLQNNFAYILHDVLLLTFARKRISSARKIPTQRVITLLTQRVMIIIQISIRHTPLRQESAWLRRLNMAWYVRVFCRTWRPLIANICYTRQDEPLFLCRIAAGMSRRWRNSSKGALFRKREVRIRRHGEGYLLYDRVSSQGYNFIEISPQVFLSRIRTGARRTYPAMRN